MHELSGKMAIPEKDASSYLCVLVRKDLATKCNEGQKDTCQWSKMRHFFYNYSEKPEMLMKRAEKVSGELRTEYEGKLAEQEANFEKKLGGYKDKLEEQFAQLQEQKKKQEQEIKQMKTGDIAFLKEALEREKTRTKMLAVLLWDFLKDR